MSRTLLSSDTKSQNGNWIWELGWFFFYLVGYTALSYWGLTISGNYYLYMFAYMWSPALAALSSCLVTRSGLGDLSLSSWGSFRSLVLGVVIPFAYGLVAYAIIWAAGWGMFNLEQLQNAVKKMGLETWPLSLAAFLYVVMFGLQGTLGNMPSSFGEELGWRGFLATRLRTRFSFMTTALIVGLVWGAWHYPLILKNADPQSPVPIGITLANFTLFTIAASVVFNWLSERARSVWPAVVLHSAHNCFILGFFERMTKPAPQSVWFTDESGVVLWAVILSSSLLLWAKTRREIRPT